TAARPRTRFRPERPRLQALKPPVKCCLSSVDRVSARSSSGCRLEGKGFQIGHLPPRAKNEERTMRVMVMVKATKESEAGVVPDEKLFSDMNDFNEELVKAGIMLAGEGLHPSSEGVRVRFHGKQRTVVDGPFAETKELVAGFWLWQVRSMDEAIEWVKRCPNP